MPVLDDAVDEGEETPTLRLTNASWARIADGEATGTIVNSDPLQTMWLSRFGRTVTGQVVEAVTGRLSGPTGGLAGDAGRAEHRPLGADSRAPFDALPMLFEVLMAIEPVDRIPRERRRVRSVPLREPSRRQHRAVPDGHEAICPPAR